MKNQKIWNRAIAFLISLTFVFQLAIPVFAETSIEPMASAGTISVADGMITITDSKGTGTVDGGVVTIKTSGAAGATQNVITITNNADYKAELKFTYNLENAANKLGLDSNAGTHTAVVEPNATIKLTIYVTKNQTATLTMSDFSLTAGIRCGSIFTPEFLRC